jgi:hypothetical protein
MVLESPDKKLPSASRAKKKCQLKSDKERFLTI